jgi:molybdopterin molybdotransferase
VLLEPGTILRPQEIGTLALAGLTRVRVAQRPRAAIISTGDELVLPGETPGLGQISDTNSSALAAAVELAGGEAVLLGVFPDRAEALESALNQALESDMVLVSGGSSVGACDLTARLIAGLGSPGILVHGVSVKPGKPTVLAVIETLARADSQTPDGSGAAPNKALTPHPKPVIGLPGHPVSALVVFDLFARPAIRQLLGLPPFPRLEFSLRARLSRNIASAPGRLDCLRVRLRREGGEVWADPVLGKSGLLTTLVQADGLAWIEPGREGLLAGEIIEVRPFQGGEV